MSARKSPSKGYLSQIANPIATGSASLKPHPNSSRRLANGPVQPPVIEDTLQRSTARPAKSAHTRQHPTLATEMVPPPQPLPSIDESRTTAQPGPQALPVQLSSPSAATPAPISRHKPQSAQPQIQSSKSPTEPASVKSNKTEAPAIPPSTLVLAAITQQPSKAAQPAPPTPATRRIPTVHIGTLEIRTRLAQPAPSASTRLASEQRARRTEARAVAPQPASGSLSRGLGWSFGLAQG